MKSFILGIALAGCTADPPRRIEGAVSPLSVRPELPDTHEIDRNNDRIDDAFSDDVAHRVDVEVILDSPIQPADLDAFARLEGRVRYVFQILSYGWTGSIPRVALSSLARSLQPRLHLIARPTQASLHLAAATQNARVRPVWDATSEHSNR